MRVLYTIAFYLSTPFILLHFAIRGLKDRAYLRRWGERFAFYKGQSYKGGIVIHAASVGELSAAVPLIHALSSKPYAFPLTISTFTPTGSGLAQSMTNGNTTNGKIVHFYAPLDLPGVVNRFFEHTKPGLLIIMETEIWPNLFHAANRRNIPVLMVNARMSGKSFISYRWFSSLTRGALSKASHVAAQSLVDLNRLVACGVRPDRITAPGNLKFDVSVRDGLVQETSVLRQQWGSDRPVLIAGSTHKEDDIVVLRSFGMILEELPETLLILVPRHPERFSAAANLAGEMGFRTELFSNGPACSPQAQCFVIDAMGELQHYYSCSDLAVIGGSFGPVGGHNALEASALGVPVIVGPNTKNFTVITDGLISNGAAIRVSNAEQLGKQAIKLLCDAGRRQAMGEAGRKIVAQGRGALRDTMDIVERLVS